MKIQSNPRPYGSVAKWFHWLTAILIFVTYCAIYYREWLAESEFESWLTIQLHFSIGLTLLVLMVLRMIWRILNPVPIHHTSSRMQQILARTVHLVMYLSIIIMVLSGYFSVADYFSRGGKIDYFFVFDLTWFKGLETENLLGVSLEQLEKPAAIIHGIVGEWILVFLIAGHILAALYHHFVLKDDTLSRMTFFKQKVTSGRKP